MIISMVRTPFDYKNEQYNSSVISQCSVYSKLFSITCSQHLKTAASDYVLVI